MLSKQEKAGGHFARAINLTNIDAGLLNDAITQVKAKANELGLLGYFQPVITYTAEDILQARSVTPKEELDAEQD